jgi:uncharacterized membrane protein
MNAIDRTEDGLAGISRTLGFAGLIAIVVPPGLVVAPLCGLAATLLGVAAIRGDAGHPERRELALTGIVLGAITLLATIALIVIFHGVIGRAIHDINNG